MGNETSKAIRRRLADPRFKERWFVGDGMDIGPGADPLTDLHFPNITNVRLWDTGSGDAMFMNGVPDESLDFVYSSHCLEHLIDARVGLFHWWRVLKPGGHMVVVVPDEDLYEAGTWPPNKNTTHYWSFTPWKRQSWCPKSLNVTDLIAALEPDAQLLKLDYLDWPFDYSSGPDQSGGDAFCGIEFVLRKRPPEEVTQMGRFIR